MVRSLAAKQSPRLELETMKVNEAEARQAEARANYLPRVTATARYVRLSDFTPPTLGSSGSLVGTLDAPGTPSPRSVALAPFSFPNILNQYFLQASIVIPLSDYVLRIHQGYRANTAALEAREHERKAVLNTVQVEAEIAYYRWVLARRAITVAEASLANQKAHLVDARSLETANLAPRAEVLRVEAEVAAAEQGLEQARNLAALAEADLRVRIGIEAPRPLEPEAALPEAEVLPDSEPLIKQAQLVRPEMRAIAPWQSSLEAAERVTRAAMLPQASAFADVTVANPNPRYVPQADKWLPTWQVGAQLTWSPSEAWQASRAGDAAASRRSQLETQRRMLADGIRMEVTRAWLDAKTADAAIGTGRAQRAAAEESYRSIREAYRAGKANATAVLDVETALSRARLAVVSAEVEAAIARARLRLASGAM
jgi:outer membrane protein TolC